MTTRIQANNIHKRFTNGLHTVDVLHDVSVAFDAHRSYAITGASGSGKSTLLHILGLLDSPCQGNILYDELDCTVIDQQQRAQMLNATVGLVFQMPYLIPQLSVLENVALKGMIQGLPFAQCTQRAYELLSKVNLQNIVDAKPAALSGGQQQRVAIVRALFTQPSFLLADEPTGNLDENHGRQVVDFLLECQSLWQLGIIVSTHTTYVTDRMQSVYHLQNTRMQQLR